MKPNCASGIALSFIIACVFPLSLVSCDLISLGGSSGSDAKAAVAYSYDANNPVIKLDAISEDSRITVSGLSGQSVILVKANPSAEKANAYTTGYLDSMRSVAGRVALSDSAMPFAESAAGSAEPVSGIFGGVTRLDCEAARNFSVASILRASSSRETVDTIASHLAVPPAGYVPFGSSDVNVKSRTFSVQNSSDTWISVTATLRARGDSCLVWVASVNYDSASSSYKDNKITGAQAAEISTKFDKVYARETNLFGYEYGGGVPSTDPSYGGVDGETRINILVYDIDYDQVADQDSGVVGFFWSKDLFPQEELSAGVSAANLASVPQSNKAEMFYLDSHFEDLYPEIAYSTLIHEFQHMINFNVKNVIPNNANGVETWYNEMLSMVAEDTLDSTIGISLSDSGHPLSRFATFNAYYASLGLTDWLSGNDVILSYAFSYAYGAYLARNYGGANLVKEIMGNGSTGIASVGAALASLGFADDFNAAFGYFGEALVFSNSDTPPGIHTFNKTSTCTVGAFDYTFERFNIWAQPNEIAGNVLYGFGKDYKGPAVWLSGAESIKPYGLALESIDSLMGATGSVSFDYYVPVDTDVVTYLVIR